MAALSLLCASGTTQRVRNDPEAKRRDLLAAIDALDRATRRACVLRLPVRVGGAERRQGLLSRLGFKPCAFVCKIGHHFLSRGSVLCLIACLARSIRSNSIRSRSRTASLNRDCRALQSW